MDYIFLESWMLRIIFGNASMMWIQKLILIHKNFYVAEDDEERKKRTGLSKFLNLLWLMGKSSSFLLSFILIIMSLVIL